MHAMLIVFLVGVAVGLWLGYKIGKGVAVYGVGGDLIKRLLGK